MYAVAVMRACPMHRGHQAVIDCMLREGGGRGHLIIGSINRERSLRYMFSYEERRELVRMKYPDLRIDGLADFPDDDQWMQELAATLSRAGANIREAIFYGGCLEDVAWLKKDNYKVRVVNRFDGEESPVVSATQVRDALLYNRSLDGLVDFALQVRVHQMFEEVLPLLPDV